MVEDIREIKGNIAKNLRYYRDLKGFTQRQLAAELGIKHNTISSWENGTNSLDAAVLMEICDLLGVSLDEMYKGEKKDSPINELSEREQYAVSLFRKLPDEEQLKIIGRLEVMTER